MIYAGVVKLVDALDSKSSGAHTPCRFDSGLRHEITDAVAILLRDWELVEHTGDVAGIWIGYHFPHKDSENLPQSI